MGDDGYSVRFMHEFGLMVSTRRQNGFPHHFSTLGEMVQLLRRAGGVRHM